MQQWQRDLERHVEKAREDGDPVAINIAQKHLDLEIDRHQHRLDRGRLIEDIPTPNRIIIIDTNECENVTIEEFCLFVLDRYALFLDLRENSEAFPSMHKIRHYLSKRSQRSAHKRFDGFCQYGQMFDEQAFQDALALLHYHLYPDYGDDDCSRELFFLVDTEQSKIMAEKIVTSLRVHTNLIELGKI